MSGVSGLAGLVTDRDGTPMVFALLADRIDRRKVFLAGLLGLIGVSTPEHDQNSVIDLMRGGWVDAVLIWDNAVNVDRLEMSVGGGMDASLHAALIANLDRYEPTPGRLVEELSAHYDVAVLPARPRR